MPAYRPAGNRQAMIVTEFSEKLLVDAGRSVAIMKIPFRRGQNWQIRVAATHS
jgi:hypothetical protein